MTRSKIFLFLMLAFILGVGSGSFFDIAQEVVLVIAIIAVSLVAVFYRRGSRILFFPVAFGAFFVLVFSAGVLRFDISESMTKVLTNFNDTNMNIELLGYINDEPQRLIDRQRLTLQVKEIRVPNYAVFTDEKVLVTAGLYPEFEYGDIVLVEGKLKSPQNFDPVIQLRRAVSQPNTEPSNTTSDSGSAAKIIPKGLSEDDILGKGKSKMIYGVDDFDYVNYLAKDGIFSLSYYPKISGITRFDFLDPDGLSVFEKIKISMLKPIFKFKNIFKDSISRSSAEPNAALVNGILLGSRENIPSDLKEAFNKTGTTHILAISGYNITILGLYVSYLLLFFMRRQKAFWVTVLAIIAFTILTGASASVIRAAIMGILVLIAYQEGRFYSMANSIVLAGTAMIILNPKVLRFDIGFQLSFLATLGLVYLAPFFKEKLEKIPEFFNLKENFVATLSAQLAVLPVILYNFGNFSLVSLPANVLILPVVPLTMLFGFISGISGLVWPPLGETIGLIAWLLTEYEILIVRAFSSIL